jgi:hypothetical protein
MGGGSGPSTNPTRLVPFEQEQDGTTKSCISITGDGTDIIRLAQNKNDPEAYFNPIMVNRTGEGYMVFIEKINDVAEDEQEISILTLSTGSPYKAKFETVVGTSESPYIRIQRGSLKNSKSTEQNLNGMSFYEFTTVNEDQLVKERDVQDGTFKYDFPLNASTKYFADFFQTESSFVLSDAEPTEMTASQSGRIMNVDAQDDSESLTANASVVGGIDDKAAIRAVYEMNPLTFTTTVSEKKQCVVSQFSDAKADPSISFYQDDTYGTNSLANTFNYTDSITTFPTSDGGFWDRNGLTEMQKITFLIDARDNEDTERPLGVTTEYPNSGLYLTQTATLIGAPTLDSNICGGTVLTGTDFVKLETDGDQLQPVKDKNEVVVAVSTIAMSGAGEVSCQTDDGIKVTWDKNGLTVNLPKDDN